MLKVTVIVTMGVSLTVFILGLGLIFVIKGLGVAGFRSQVDFIRRR